MTKKIVAFALAVLMIVAACGISLAENVPTILLFYGIFAVCMFIAVNIGYWVANGDKRTGWVSAFSMCTMGEFAFIISKQALDNHVFEQSVYSSIVGAAIVSMIMLPFLVRSSDKTLAIAGRVCPGFLKSIGGRISRERDMAYRGFAVASYRTKDRFSKAITNSAFLVAIIVAIEVIFFYAYSPLSDWLVSNYGADEQTWRIAILVANILILLEPCRRLSKIMRFTMYLINKGKTQIGVPQDKVAAYVSFSSLAFGSAITLIIVILVPNGIDSLLHVAVLLALFIIISLTQYLMFRRGRKTRDKDEEHSEGGSQV